jgi:hypothetical protein
VGRLLVIVGREEPARYAYLRHVFASETVEVITDRRREERRRREMAPPFDKRRGERRVRSILQDLHSLGWALVRR